MLTAAQAFEDGGLPIDKLSWELKSRIAALSHIANAEWVEHIRTMRNQIDLVNAVHLDSGLSALTPDERREVSEVLHDLRNALSSRPLGA
jgi:hypothetical protein